MSAKELQTSLSIGDVNPPETPYSKASREWDNRIGSAVARAANWRISSILQSVIIVVSLIGLIILAASSNTEAFFVTLTADNEYSVAKGNLSTYTPTDNQVRHHLIKFIEKVRTVTADFEVNKRFLSEAYAFATPNTANFLDCYYQQEENNPQARMLKELVVVKVTDYTAVSDSTYQIRWDELAYDANNGKQKEPQSWTAFVKVKLVTPKDEETLIQNPLGIWVAGLQWSSSYKGDN